MRPDPQLEIGHISGWINHPSSQLNRRLSDVKSVIEEAVRPHRLITVPSHLVRSDLPVILDVTVDSEPVRRAIDSIKNGHIKRPWFVICMADYSGVRELLPAETTVHGYRNASHVRPLIKTFLDWYPGQIKHPLTISVVSRTKIA